MHLKSIIRNFTIFSSLLFACIGCEKYEPPIEPVADRERKIELKTPSTVSNRRLVGDENADQVPVDRSKENELPTLDDVLPAKTESSGDESDEREQEVHSIDIPETWTRLSPQQEIWVDMKTKQVIAGGFICLNAGPLEVFVCPAHTKEHESVVSINASAEQVHAALLAIGAEPGKPVQWIGEYKPATGDVIEVQVMWKQNGEIVKKRGQELILNIKTGKTMQHDWVFGGSIIETVEATEDSPAQSFYLANSGELVCVSNFSTATLDVPVKSSDANHGLLYEANTPNIPDVGTKTYVIFSKKK